MGWYFLDSIVLRWIRVLKSWYCKETFKVDSAQHLISCICYDCICYDCAILNACVQCCSLSLPSSLCPQFPVFAKLLGVRVFRDTSSCSWTPGLVSYYDCRSHIILVYSFCLCNFNIDDVLQLNVSPPPTHTHMHTHPQSSPWCSLLVWTVSPHSVSCWEEWSSEGEQNNTIQCEKIYMI